MAKVKINPTDYRWFAETAETAGTSVDEWLAEAGRAQAVKEEHGTSRVAVAYSNPQNEVWFATLLDLATEVRSPQQLAYLNRCQLQTVVDDTALLTAPDAFTRDVIESRLRAPIAEALSRRLNRPVHVAVTLTRPPDAPRPAAATPRPRADRNPPPATSPSSGGLTEAVNEFIARDKRRSDPRLRRLTYTVTGPDDNGCRATVAEHPALSHHADTPAAALFGLLDRIVGALDGKAGA